VTANVVMGFSNDFMPVQITRKFHEVGSGLFILILELLEHGIGEVQNVTRLKSSSLTDTKYALNSAAEFSTS
jgi:hypothetical protein